MKKIIISIIFVLYNQTIFAFPGEPVYDYENWYLAGQQLLELEDQLKEMKKLNIVSGTFDNLFEKDEFWQLMTDIENLQAIINGKEVGAVDEALKQSAGHYREMYGELRNPDYYNPENSDSYSAFSQSDHSNAVMEGLTTSKAMIERSAELNTLIGGYADENYSLETQKQAIDFGNNLQIELLRVMNEMLRLQAQQVRLMAAAENETAQNNDFNSKFFNTDFYQK
jgi:conjugal transfer/entry exclusion protein